MIGGEQPSREGGEKRFASRPPKRPCFLAPVPVGGSLAFPRVQIERRKEKSSGKPLRAEEGLAGYQGSGTVHGGQYQKNIYVTYVGLVNFGCILGDFLELFRIVLC